MAAPSPATPDRRTVLHRDLREHPRPTSVVLIWEAVGPEKIRWRRVVVQQADLAIDYHTLDYLGLARHRQIRYYRQGTEPLPYSPI